MIGIDLLLERLVFLKDGVSTTEGGIIREGAGVVLCTDGTFLCDRLVVGTMIEIETPCGGLQFDMHTHS